MKLVYLLIFMSMNDSNKGNGAVTSGPGNKPSCERLEKSIEIECELLSQAILGSMGNFTLYFFNLMEVLATK